MTDPTRREMLQVSAGLASGLGAAVVGAQPKQTDRDFVLGAGLTPEEADCWQAIADAAGKFFALPKLHPMDTQEVATAIHVIQHKLLARPTYRRYLELAKAGAK